MSLGIIDSLDELVRAYRDLLVRARIPAESVDIRRMVSKNLIYNILTGTVLLLACRILLLRDQNLLNDFVLNLSISIAAFFVVFIVSTIILTRYPNRNGQRETDKWSIFLIFIWIYSLVLIIADQAISLMFKARGLGLGWIAPMFAGGPILPIVEDDGYIAAAVTYSLLAIVILLIRTFFNGRLRRRMVAPLVISCVVGLFFNSTLLVLFVFGGIKVPA
jgi:hypothetical protein